MAIVVFFASFYMLSYSGWIQSGDALSYFDDISSLVNFGDNVLDETFWTNPVNRPAVYPFRTSDDPEELQNVLAIPLYESARLLSLGRVQTVWLFSIVVVALAVGVFFLFAIALGYGEGVAVLAAITLGLGTVLWPYTKDFFREPLILLFLLTGGLLLERWRGRRYRSYTLPILAVVMLCGAFLTKNTAVFAFPALLIVAFPHIGSLWRSRWIRGLVAAGILALLAAPIVIIAANIPLDTILGIGTLALDYQHPGQYLSYTVPALHAYLFSIGGSIWGTSPVLVLAAPGLMLSVSRGRWRYVGVTMVAVLGYALGYAILRGPHWFGGVSWPPRFLVPVVPFAMLATLPMFARLVRRPRPIWLWGGFAILLLYGLWVQINGVALDWGQYAVSLPPESNGVIEWSTGLNVIRYLRWVVLPGLWPSLGPDFAWARVHLFIWPLAFGGLAVGAAGFITAELGSVGANSRRRWLMGALPLVWLLFAGIGLRALYYDDPLFRGSTPALHDALQEIDSSTSPGDVVLLSDNTYGYFVLNYAGDGGVRFFGLPSQPGERAFPDKAPDVESPNAAAVLTGNSVAAIRYLAERHDRLWLLTNAGPYIPWAVRPVERFLAQYFYPLRELPIDPPDPAVRVIEFSTVNAPDPFAFREPDTLTSLRFGDSIRLLGYVLPSGSVYAPEAVLPISLYWESDSAVGANYRVALYVASAAGAVVAQGEGDPEPQWGFAPVSSWQPGVPLWDNRAVRLPVALAAGTYHLWLVMYPPGQPDPADRLPVSGGEVREGTVGVLPTAITVQPK